MSSAAAATVMRKNDSNCISSKHRAMGWRVPCIDTSMHMEDLTNGLFSLCVWLTTIRRYYPTRQSTKKTFVRKHCVVLATHY
jgi:type I site-specific restriction-modification system R (restriction) subunit